MLNQRRQVVLRYSFDDLQTGQGDPWVQIAGEERDVGSRFGVEDEGQVSFPLVLVAFSCSTVSVDVGERTVRNSECGDNGTLVSYEVKQIVRLRLSCPCRYTGETDRTLRQSQP